MKEQRALQTIRDEFQRFQLDESLWPKRRSFMIPREKSELLAHALRFLCQTVQIDRAAVFLYDDEHKSLMARQLVDGGDVLPGEEEIAVMDNSPIHRLLMGKRDSLILTEPHPLAYIPLRAFGHIFGVLRVENVRRHRRFSDADMPLLNDFAHELATTLKGLEMSISERDRVSQMKALHEVSNAIFRSLRMDEMLKSVAQSLIQQLGFDRVKVYLINKEGESLESVLTLDQRQHSEGEKESFALKRGVHPMVDLILGRTSDERIEKYQRTIMYFPMRTRDENMGVLMVDNLLSQQEIPAEQIPILSAIANQLGLAIKNSRLFQGVEELSITDGLTGLYLLRYFKQRLKEEFFRAERTHSHLSLMILDIDHFKKFNDTYGHQAGDTILSTVAERVLANARKVDITARYGGDEFVIILPDTAPDEAMLLADRLHQGLSKEPVQLANNVTVGLTVSIGVATYPSHAGSIEELIRRAAWSFDGFSPVSVSDKLSR
jgi:diguanylate cyclase (GGDEF)-like protein